MGQFHPDKMHGNQREAQDMPSSMMKLTRKNIVKMVTNNLPREVNGGIPLIIRKTI